MNKFILCAMDWANKTSAELMANRIAAYKAYTAVDAAYTAYTAAAVAAATYNAVANANVTYSVAAHDAAAHIDYHINRYFKFSGENRADYEKALERKNE